MESKARRTVDINIFGREHQLKFTINALEMLEATTDDRSITVTATKPVWSMKDIISGLHAGLKWQLPKLTRDQVKDGVQALLRETSMFEIQSLITAAIGLSGLVFGDAARSPFADILSEEADNSAEGENEKVTRITHWLDRCLWTGYTLRFTAEQIAALTPYELLPSGTGKNSCGKPGSLIWPILSPSII